jgi:hypothetical protein
VHYPTVFDPNRNRVRRRHGLPCYFIEMFWPDLDVAQAARKAEIADKVVHHGPALLLRTM